MMKTTLSALALFGFASASHFRYGTISWAPNSGNTVTFEFRSAWNRNYWESKIGGFDDNKIIAGEKFEVPSGSKGNKWYYGDDDAELLKVDVQTPTSKEDPDYGLEQAQGSSIMQHTYPTPAAPGGVAWTAGFFGCCRLSGTPFGDPVGVKAANLGLNNNGERMWDVKAYVDLTGGPGGPDTSPYVVGKPILRLRMDFLEVFDVVAIDRDDDDLTWRLGEGKELGEVANKQPGYGANTLRNGEPMTEKNKLSIETITRTNSRNDEVRLGVATWDTNGLHEGYWQAVIMIMALRSTVPYDFLLLLRDPMGNIPPEFVDPTPSVADPLEVNCNNRITYIVKAMDQQGENQLLEDEILIYNINIPPVGLEHGPVTSLGVDGAGNPIRNPVQQEVIWTPACTQDNKYIICYQATDTNPVQPLDSRVQCVIISVVKVVNVRPRFVEPTPNWNMPGVDAQRGLCVGKKVSFIVKVIDDNKDDIVMIQFEGVPANAVIGAEEWEKFPRKNVVARSFNWEPRQDQGSVTVCFQGMEIKREAELKTLQQCVFISVRYPPKFVEPTPGVDSPTECAQMESYVNERLTFIVKADDNNKEDGVSIFVREDPGLPHGALVNTNECPQQPTNCGDATNCQVACNPVGRTFDWTPTIGQEGMTYSVRFRARDNRNFCEPGGYFSTNDACVEITVYAPMPEFVEPSPVYNKVHTGYTGCVTNFCLSAADLHGKYPTRMEMQSDANGLPRDAMLSQAVLQDEAGKMTVSRCFQWKPRRGQEGFIYTVCFMAHDVGFLRMVKHCQKIDVVRGKYCVQHRDDMLSIALDYDLDWLQLWGANIDVATPDHLYDNMLINLCPTYVVRENDALDWLAERFGTTPAHILSMNPDIRHEDKIRTTQELTICPGICNDIGSRLSDTAIVDSKTDASYTHNVVNSPAIEMNKEDG